MAQDADQCVWCGRVTWRIDLTIEHLLPRSRGGQTRPENLAIACRSCNRMRGAKPVVAYVRERMRTGDEPPLAELSAALARLAGSESSVHAEYGRRQLALLARVADVTR